jgi:hypothetical protein
VPQPGIWWWLVWCPAPSWWRSLGVWLPAGGGFGSGLSEPSLLWWGLFAPQPLQLVEALALVWREWLHPTWWEACLVHLRQPKEALVALLQLVIVWCPSSRSR